MLYTDKENIKKYFESDNDYLKEIKEKTNLNPQKEQYIKNQILSKHLNFIFEHINKKWPLNQIFLFDGRQ